jgi:hypothetical protein
MLPRRSESGNFRMDRTADALLVTIMPRHHHANGPLAITLSCKRLDAVTVVFEDHVGFRMALLADIATAKFW